MPLDFPNLWWSILLVKFFIFLGVLPKTRSQNFSSVKNPEIDILPIRAIIVEKENTMTKNIFDEKGSHNDQMRLIRACRNHVGNLLEAYGKSPAHTYDIIKGKSHLAQQVSRVKQQAIKEFSEQVVARMDLTKTTLSRAHVLRHLRLWLRRQTEVSGLTTHSLASIGPNDIQG